MNVKIGKFDVKGSQKGKGWVIFVDNDLSPTYLDFNKNEKRWKLRGPVRKGLEPFERELSQYLLTNNEMLRQQR